MGRRDRHRNRATQRRSRPAERPLSPHAVALDSPTPQRRSARTRAEGVDRIIEVAFSDNVDLDAAVAKNHTVIAAYATREDRPDFPFWPMLFDNVTIRLLGSDDFPAAAKRQAATDLTSAARQGKLSIPVGEPFDLAHAAQAHDSVDRGTRERVLLEDSFLAGPDGGSDASL